MAAHDENVVLGPDGDGHFTPSNQRLQYNCHLIVKKLQMLEISCVASQGTSDKISSG